MDEKSSILKEDSISVDENIKYNDVELENININDGGTDIGSGSSNHHGHSHNGEKKKKKDKHAHSSAEHGHSHGKGHSHAHGAHNEDSNDDDEEALLKHKLKTIESRKKAKLSLIVCLCLTTIFMIGEIIGGWIANSLAIMSDAAHLLTDIGAMLLSLFAMWFSQRLPTSSMSFGFHRAEILGAVISILTIWALTGVLVYEAVQRIINPPEVIDGKIMFILACCGLLINVIDAIILHWGSGGHGHSHGGGHGHSHGGGHSHSQKKKKQLIKDDDELETGQKKGKSVKNINVHSAYIHVLGDCFQSIGVMIAAIIIWIKPEWKIADPITTLIFSVIVLVTTVRLLRDSISVLMEGVPPEIDVAEVKDDLSDIEGVTQVHDLHIWSITVGRPALSVHLTISPETDSEQTLSAANKILLDNYEIAHTTIQIEKPVDKSNCVQHSCPPPFDIKNRKKNHQF